MVLESVVQAKHVALVILMIFGIPEYIRSDNGSEFIAKKLHSWLSDIGVKTAYIEPGSPWENGFCESL